MRRSFLSLTLAIALTMALGVEPLWAQSNSVKPDSGAPVLLTADELIYDETLGTVTARGGVELEQNGRILLADTVTYSQRGNTVTASGNISLLEPSGEVVFAEFVELSDEMKKGFIRDLSVLLSDGSRFAARQAQRVAGQSKTMDRAVFSPCNLCKEDPGRPPVWQIKAIRVIHDEVRREVEYEDAVLEMFGIPVLYTPYFSHPDPTVKRRSGFLAPTIGQSDELGTIFGQPYFWAIDRSRDLELEPILYSREGVILRSRYRQRLSRGELDLGTTAAFVDEREDGGETGEKSTQASADLKGRWSLDDTWRAGFDYQQASQRTYLRRYDLGDQQILTSRLFAEGFSSTDYGAVNAYKFQGLRAGDRREISPIVAPFAEMSLIGEPDDWGGRVKFDASLMSLTRALGADSRRLSLAGNWSLPHYSEAGWVTTVTAAMQGDVYFTNNATDTTGVQAEGEEETAGRIFPQVGLNWRYPLVRRGPRMNQLIEPIVNVVAGPNGSNPDEIPNEDSLAFEFDDTNLFRLNRYEGVDRVTSGARVDYGIRLGVFGDSGGSTSLMVGQSYRFWGNSAFSSTSGLDENLSDIVGRVHVAPRNWLDLLYRFRFDKDDLGPNRNELGVRIRGDRVELTADYIVLDESLSTTGFGDREQIDFALGAKITDTWSARLDLIQDLSSGQNTTRKAGFGLVYSDECISVGLRFERTDLEDEDIKPDDRVFLRVNFKYLGAVQGF
jgi:LPS-assembly protein